ncbi:MAG: acyltransferase [Terriglobales bacterium]
MTSAPKTGHLPTLDGWRAVAILAVMLDHTAEYSSLRNYPKMVSFTHTGPNGVSLFFAISGFLICSRLLEEDRAFGQISLRGFYIRRACRILPPAMFYLIVIGALSLCGLILVSPWDWWSSVLFFRNYLPPGWISRGWGGYTVHYWSLAVEEHFYFLWPGALVLMGKTRARWFALSLAISVAAWRTWDLHRHWFDRWIPGLLFGCRTDVRLDALLLGCVAALILNDDAVRAAFSQGLKPWMWWLCVGCYVAAQFIYLSRQSRSYSLFESALLPLVVAGTVYGPKTFVTTLLESRGMKWIGRLSYSLYLWQQLFSVPAPGSKFAILQRPPLSTGMILLCAWLSYRFIERPFIRWGHHLAPPLTEGRDDLARHRRKELTAKNDLAEVAHKTG